MSWLAQVAIAALASVTSPHEAQSAAQGKAVQGDFDGDQRLDQARLVTSKTTGEVFLTVTFATGEERTLFADEVASLKDISLEMRPTGDARCRNWTNESDAMCGYALVLSAGPALVLHQRGKDDVVFRVYDRELKIFYSQRGSRTNVSPWINRRK